MLSILAREPCAWRQRLTPEQPTTALARVRRPASCASRGHQFPCQPQSRRRHAARPLTCNYLGLTQRSHMLRDLRLRKVQHIVHIVDTQRSLAKSSEDLQASRMRDRAQKLRFRTPLNMISVFHVVSFANPCSNKGPIFSNSTPLGFFVPPAERPPYGNSAMALKHLCHVFKPLAGPSP